MENQKVVIRIIDGGQKKYVTNIQPSSYSYRTSKNPFGDADVLKLDTNTAMDFAKKHNSFYKKVQVIDINGNNLYNTVGNVINEEVQNFLNESYTMEHENFKFRQEIKNSSFYNYDNFSNDFDVDINESDIFVDWHIAFWLNDYGVEHFIVEVDSVDGTYKVGLLNKQTDEMEQENDKNIAEFQWKFIVDEATLYLGKTLYISTLDFDFKTKTCRVTFFDENNQY
jgi:hypothetical protein